jgi:hypothetical protein
MPVLDAGNILWHGHWPEPSGSCLAAPRASTSLVTPPRLRPPDRSIDAEGDIDVQGALASATSSAMFEQVRVTFRLRATPTGEDQGRRAARSAHACDIVTHGVPVNVYVVGG